MSLWHCGHMDHMGIHVHMCLSVTAVYTRQGKTKTYYVQVNFKWDVIKSKGDKIGMPCTHSTVM